MPLSGSWLTLARYWSNAGYTSVLMNSSAYEQAIDEMLLKTSTLAASWMVIEGDEPLRAQVKTLSFLVNAFARELDYGLRDPFKKSGGKKKKKAKSKKSKKK